MPNAVQHPALVIGMLNLLHLDHLSLFQYLHGVEAVVVFGLDEVDATEAPGTEGALQHEILLRVLALGGALLVDGLLGLLRLRSILLLNLARIGRVVHDIVDAGGIVGLAMDLLLRLRRHGGLHGGA